MYFVLHERTESSKAYVNCYLPLNTKGAVAITLSAFKERPFTVQMQKEELSSASVL
jgi:hypothetical protein